MKLSFDKNVPHEIIAKSSQPYVVSTQPNKINLADPRKSILEEIHTNPTSTLGQSIQDDMNHEIQQQIMSSSFDNAVPLYESTKSIDEDDLSSSETPKTEPKIRQVKDWKFNCEYPNVAGANAALAEENMWSQFRKKESIDGTKVFFRCNKVKLRGRQCSAEIYYIFKCDSEIVSEYRTTARHNHDEILNEDEGKVKKNVQIEVEKLFDLGLKPKPIMHALSKIQGIQLPTRQQLTTMIAALRKRKLGPVTISLNELSTWLQEHSEVPQPQHKPFVICHEVNTETTEPFFRFVITTKHLLSLTKLRDFSHCDTTYKIVWQGFPVFMAGTTDWDKAYHPYGLAVCSDEKTEDFLFLFNGLKYAAQNVLNFEMKQKAIVCDAAGAISNAFLQVFGDDAIVVMCWFHAKKAMENELKIVNKENQLEILSDIEFLHLASNPTIFNNAADLFLRKWKNKEEAYCQYFEKEWLQKHRNWFLGAVDHTPCHNNALEAANRYLKDSHTIRIRHPLPHFLTVAMETVEKWSNEYEIGLKKFATKPTISLKLWTDSYNWARSDIPLKVIQQNEFIITIEVEAQVVRAKRAKGAVVVSENSSASPSQLPKAKCDNDQYFEEYKLSFLKWTTTITKKPNCLSDGKCNCVAFAKEYICKHVVGLAIRLKYVLPPLEAKTVPIGQKRKRGRPTKTKPALMVQ